MPLDATNFSETIPAPLTLEDLIAWLRTKPADKKYWYINPGHCLWSQYLIDRGLAKKPAVGMGNWYDRGDPSRTSYLIPGARNLYDRTGWGNQLAIAHPRTFGAALDRALTYAATGKV